jgi:hypothetical protein
MKRQLRVGIGCVNAVIGLALSVAGITTSPKDIVGRFIEMDVHGTRLTARGWRAADMLFVQSSSPPQEITLVVVAHHYGVGEAVIKGNTAELYVGYEELARITPSLDFRPINSRFETRSMYKYDLLLTDGNRTGGQPPGNPKESAEWKIEGTQPTEMRVTADTAIRYVTKMRDETKDLVVKKNANRTLAQLKLYN